MPKTTLSARRPWYEQEEDNPLIALCYRLQREWPRYAREITDRTFAWDGGMLFRFKNCSAVIVQRQ